MRDQEWYANVPISEPNRGFTAQVSFNGFGWDRNQGLIIPVLDEPSSIELPIVEFIMPSGVK
jgi:hypothetical protein